MSQRISLLLVDDHALVRNMLCDRLSCEPDMVVVGKVENADLAVTEAFRLRPDVVVMDIDMPGVACFEAARMIQTECLETRIVFLSAFSNDRYIEQALEIEASGYLTKTAPPEEVVCAIRMVAAGRTYFSPEIQERIVVDQCTTRLSHARQCRSSTLTPRELEVLRYIARGLKEREIAETMHLSPKTVHCHTANLMNKLNIHRAIDLARFAIREGLAEA